MRQSAGKLVQKFKYITFNIPVQLLCIIYSLIVLIPVTWAVVSSLRSSIDFFVNPFGLPSKFLFQNFIKAWNEGNVGVYFRNSTFITVISVFLIIFASSFAAYALSRLKFVGRIPILTIFISGFFISPALLILPLFLLLQQLHILGSYVGLVLVYIAYSLPFTIFVLVPFFNVIPQELEEAAFLDGASHFKVFFKVVLPLASPGIILATIFNVFGIWNEFILAYVLISDEKLKTLPVGLANILVKQHYTADYGVVFAAIAIAIAPITIIYIIFQRKLTGKLLSGALKE
ncbi:MAG: carbohydrate ABC transporter permease [Actinobacteria bacterium]|nr:carbohydrate ABC transporter permease [Actinomycetota bacterium]